MASSFLSLVMQRWPDKRARLTDGFYKVKTKDGNIAPFSANPDQLKYLDERHGMDVILKARQKGFCLSGDTRILTADLRWVEMRDMKPGDQVVAVDEDAPKGRGKSRLMRTAEVLACVEVHHPAYRITLEDGRSVVCTDKHPWLTKKVGTDTAWRSLSGRRKIKIGTKIRSITTPWDEPTYEDGWFGGILDGEGSFRFNPPRLSACQRPTHVWDRMLAYCVERGYSEYRSVDDGTRENTFGNRPVNRLEFGRMDEIFRVLGQCRPTRFVNNRFWEGCVLPGKRSDAQVWFAVTNIEYVGEQVLYDLQTTTGTYIAEGLVSHNTTIIQLDMLDDCLFIPNTSAGVVAHTVQDAKAFFADKIKFAYDQLPPEFKQLVTAEQDSADSLKFSNGSSIRVGTSLRSGTLQRLHVSEYGKLCAKFPEKAREVKSGAFNTVQVGQNITVESTAEGQSGHFYEMTEIARKMAEMGAPLTALDFKFHFAPWWTTAEYVLHEPVIETSEMRRYFLKLEDQGIYLTKEQRAWYVKKAEQQLSDMKREYPSTPNEAFEASVEGAFLFSEMSRLRRDGRICKIPVERVEVDTFWDLGVNDDMVIWFRQRVGPEHRFIDYYANSGEGLDHYARIIKEKAAERNYVLGKHYLPHDGSHRRLGYQARSVEQMLPDVGISPIVVCARIPDEKDGIEASRAYLAKCWFDEANCAEGIKCLDNYRREWDDTRAVWKDRPRHDWASHGYKGFETAAIAPDYHVAKPREADRYERARYRRASAGSTAWAT